MAVSITNVSVAGTLTQLLSGDNSRLALVFFTNDPGGGFVGPSEGLTPSGNVFALPLQKPLRFRVRDYGEMLGREWWYSGGMIGTINCIEVWD